MYTYTADFMKTVLSVYTHSMTTAHLSLSAQVAKSTFFMKSLFMKNVHKATFFFDIHICTIHCI